MTNFDLDDAVGVPREDGESWDGLADRLTATPPGHCPNCEKLGQGDDQLAPNQRWCPDEACPVVSFWGASDAE